MTRLTADGSEIFASLPDAHAIYYVGLDSSLITLDRTTNFVLRRLFSEGIDRIKYGTSEEFKGNGKLILTIDPTYFRGISEPQTPRKGLERFLGESEYINPNDSLVADVARDIRGKLESADKDNPVSQAEAIMHWIEANIEPLSAPKELTDYTEAVVNGLHGVDRTNAYKIFNQIFPNWNDEIVRQFSSQIKLPSAVAEKNDRTIAKLVLDQANILYGGDKISARGVLESGGSKCVGFAHLYIALARNLGIPSQEVGGYYFSNGRGGKHSWAASHIKPFGWIEADPMMGQFENFDYEAHAYRLCRFEGKTPQVMVYSGSNQPTNEQIDKVLGHFDAHKNMFDRITGRANYPRERDFLESLRAQQ